LRQPRGGPAEGEAGCPLTRGGVPAFGKIRSPRRSFGERPISRRLFAHAGGNGVDRALSSSDRHLTQVRKPAGVIQHSLLQRCLLQRCLDPPIDKADRQRFVGLDPPRSEQKILGPRWPDELDQAARLGMPIDEAELGRGDREMGVGGAKPQVARERQAKPAADGDPAITAMVGRSRSMSALSPSWSASP
jgi:hypothetical protein